MSVQEAVAERDNVHDPFTDVGFSNPSDSAFYNPYIQRISYDRFSTISLLASVHLIQL